MNFLKVLRIFIKPNDINFMYSRVLTIKLLLTLSQIWRDMFEDDGPSLSVRCSDSYCWSVSEFCSKSKHKMIENLFKVSG